MSDYYLLSIARSIDALTARLDLIFGVVPCPICEGESSHCEHCDRRGIVVAGEDSGGYIGPVAAAYKRAVESALDDRDNRLADLLGRAIQGGANEQTIE